MAGKSNRDRITDVQDEIEDLEKDTRKLENQLDDISAEIEEKQKFLESIEKNKDNTKQARNEASKNWRKSNHSKKTSRI